MAKSRLRVASCQFSVEADIAHNRAEILRQIDEAAAGGARLVHFSEAALSGYLGVDVLRVEDLDLKQLRQATEDILAAAAKRKVWVLLGSAHPLSNGRRPHNCVYVINDEGKIVDRYDKRFCTGLADPESLDLAHYTPGDHSTVFEVDGWKCATLICYDYRFPELFRDLKRQGVEAVFQSFHNARRPSDDDNIWRDIVPATMMCHAAVNYFWISATNSTTKWSCWPNFFVRPDGVITGKLTWHEPGVLLSHMDPEAFIWDAAGPWRDRAMAGCLHSGALVDDPRSTDRTSL